jgi:cytochrome c551
MLRLTIRSIPLILTAVTLLTACGEKTGPLESAPQTVQTLYRNNCMQCHGDGLQGRIGPVTDLREVGSRLSAAQIIERIEQGGETMPPFADRLESEEIRQLAEWLAGLTGSGH